MSENEEIAKAVQETAKFCKDSVEALTKMGNFVARICGAPIENAVGILGDQIEYTRWERQKRLIDKVNEYQNKRGLTQFRPVPPKFAIPIIFNASIEENDDLQDMWCRLLTNCSDPKFELEIRYAFIDIIKSMTPLDARILNYIYDFTLHMNKLIEDRNSKSYNRTLESYITLEPKNSILDQEYSKNKKLETYPISLWRIAWALGMDTSSSHEKIEISLYNLKRVHCIWDNYITEISENIDELKDELNSGSTLGDPSYKITPLGEAFILACMRETRSDSEA